MKPLYFISEIICIFFCDKDIICAFIIKQIRRMFDEPKQIFQQKVPEIENLPSNPEEVGQCIFE